MSTPKFIQKMAPSNERVHLMSDRDVLVHMLMATLLAFSAIMFAMALRDVVLSGAMSRDMVFATVFLGVTLAVLHVWKRRSPVFHQRDGQEEASAKS